MLKNIPIFLTFCCISAQMMRAKPVLLQLTPEQIRETFDNVMSDEYIQVLAKDFASKAAQHFVKEMKYQKDALASKFGHTYKTQISRLSLPKLQQAQSQVLKKVKTQAHKGLAQAEAIKAQLQAHQQTQAQATAETEVDVDADAEAENQMHAQKQGQVQLQAETQAKPKVQAQVQVHQALVQAQAQAQALAQAQAAQQNAQFQQSFSSNMKLKDLLDSHEALNLLKDPAPDGDHLDSQSGELSGERDKIPVIQVMKINGAYYRRLLGLI